MVAIELVGDDIRGLVDLPPVEGPSAMAYGPWESLTEDDLEFEMFDEYGLPAGGHESFLAEVVAGLTNQSDFEGSAREVAESVIAGDGDEDMMITKITVSEDWHIRHHDGLTALTGAFCNRQTGLNLPEVELWVLRPDGKLELC